MARIKRTTGALALVAALVMAGIVLPSSPAAAWPGDRDSTFGDCGAIDTPGGVGTPKQVLASPDGRLWVVEMYRTAPNAPTTSLILHRYLPDGRPDPSFGEGGTARSELRYQPFALEVAALTPAGGIVVGANDRTDPNNFVARIYRFAPDGSLDPFQGPAEVAHGSGSQVSRIGVQADGSVVAGINGSRTVRLTPDGHLDTSYAGDGVLEASFSALQPDGKLVSGVLDGLRRFTADGEPDLAFGSDGTATFPRSWNGVEGYPSWPREFAVDSDGRIVALRQDHLGFTLVRVTSMGEVDETFGGDGVVHHEPLEGWQDTGTVNPSFTIDSAGRPIVLRLGGFELIQSRPSVKLLRFASTSGAEAGLDQGFGFGGMAIASGLPEREGFWFGGVVSTDEGLVVTAGNYHGRTFLRFESEPAEAPSGYTLSGWGSLHPWGSSAQDLPPCVVDAPYWPGWDIARGVTMFSDASGGYVLSGWGSLHEFTPYPELAYIPPQVDGPYWEGWDIARDVALEPTQGGGGLILSGWGSLHPFEVEGGSPPPKVLSGPYWPGWDIARGVAFMPGGRSGYVLDAWGGLHPFALNGGTPPPRASGLAYWPGWDIARGVTLLPDGTGGFVVDGWGGIHPFGVGDHPEPAIPEIAAYWRGWDIVEGVTVFEP